MKKTRRSELPEGRVVKAFKQMQAAGVTPHVFTYSSLISAYDKGGQWQKAECG